MSKLRRIIDTFLDLIYPPRCAGCDSVINISSREAFCPECRKKWEKYKDDICRRCGQPIRECWCGVPGNSNGYVDYEYHLVQYNKHVDGIVKNLIYICKNRTEKRVFDTVATEMYNELYFRLDFTDIVVTAVPRSQAAKRKHGHDQGVEIAKRFSEISGVEYVDVLIHQGNKKQKRLSHSERLKNAKKSYKIKNGSSKYLKSKNVILIDDVVTTGATTVRCAQLLKMRGAEKVVVFAIAKTM